MTAAQAIVAAYPAVRLMIGGEWRAAGDTGTLDVLNPASGAVIGQVARATSSDIEDAAHAAAEGFRAWRVIPAVKRAAVMRGAATLLRERSTQIALLMTLEQGKPLAESRGEIFAAADIVDWFAEEGCRTYGRIVAPRSAKGQQLVMKEPVGPVAAFTPWNFPVNQVVRKLAVTKGARVASGGERLHGRGYFFAPTVLDQVPRHASNFNEEPFGPVAAVSGFDRLDDAIEEANRLPYGLAGYACSRSFATIHRLMHQVEVGMLWINQPATPFPELPFGGVKDSGYGSEGGPEALDAYLVSKAVSLTAY